ncbi:unnamed protein product [Lota lota]
MSPLSCPPTPSPLSCIQSQSSTKEKSPAAAPSSPHHEVVVPITPSKSAKSVRILLSPTGSRDETPVPCTSCVQLTKRVEVLERFMRDVKDSGVLGKAHAASSSSPAVFQSPSPRKKFQHTARTPQLKSTAIGNALIQFQRSSLGCKEGAKDKENARTRRGHAQRFTEYMMKQTIKSMQSAILKDVVTHRQAIKRKKSRALKESSTPADLDMVYGYIAGYLAIVSGHRPVVFTSLKIKDINEAERKGDRFVLWVGEHKTQRSFGHARLPLYKEEYKWLTVLTLIVSTLCEDAVWLFVRRDGKAVAKLNQYLTSAWRDAGLEGEINFNMVRSSVSTQAKKHLSVEDRTLVATSTWPQRTHFTARLLTWKMPSKSGNLG